MKPKAHILLVEDDQSLAFIIRDNLEKESYKVTLATDGAEALKIFDPTLHELIILDVMLPKVDGFTCAAAIRKIDKNRPILFLTAKSMEADKIAGFESGGDDYITKPFSFKELVLRIEVFLKRSQSIGYNIAEDFCFGNLSFNHRNLQLLIGSDEKSLTQKEADLLKYMLMHKNVLLKREEILTKLWGDDDYFMGRSLDVFISRLRKHLTKADSITIQNNHGVGFMLVVKDRL